MRWRMWGSRKPVYRVLLNGQGMLGAGMFPGFAASQRFGFYTTRWVEANSQEEAIREAIALVFQELRKQNLTPPECEDGLVAKECVEIPRKTWDGRHGGGFSWYPEDQSLQGDLT